jgi:cyclopropane fatty-acyl-phospholipid synthase-like methyltransferase
LIRLKKLAKEAPLIGPAAQRVRNLPMVAALWRRLGFRGSASYWEARYQAGGTSGAGSRGRLAEFKAEIINDFVARERIGSVIEFGCGDGDQLALGRYPEYVGVDIAKASIDRCVRRFANDRSKRFYVSDALPADLGSFDLALSLDVIYHLVEDSVFEAYMGALFAHATRHVVVYASNVEAPANMAHVRHREFTAWIQRNVPEWQPSGYVANRYPYDPNRPDTSFCDFHFFTRYAS